MRQPPDVVYPIDSDSLPATEVTARKFRLLAGRLDCLEIASGSSTSGAVYFSIPGTKFSSARMGSPLVILIFNTADTRKFPLGIDFEGGNLLVWRPGGVHPDFVMKVKYGRR